ncbi:MAG: hypothetical protein FD174_460 [Geobacteraceae bacterium]|nr:MAG: hypothetical protein FD174_460 [Geobacteraceae bacterium]
MHSLTRWFSERYFSRKAAKGERVRLDAGFRADIIVDDSVIVELKSLEKVAPVHKKQLTTYLMLEREERISLKMFGGEKSNA